MEDRKPPLGRSGAQANVMVFEGDFGMNALAIFVIFGCLTFAASGFLLVMPSKKAKLSSNEETFEESRARTEFYLRQMRREQGEH